MMSVRKIREAAMASLDYRDSRCRWIGHGGD
ncbi:hypothetical protein V473_23290 [Sphingobium cupriresistens LL01]|uniref:Uncharacterized protein n=1 Tax=Sphingobium cupriresistens LL01 TaxID=1420583 RepID=A0A0J8A8C4_9SPHN|nr:hypothetical protein V473_23290 [Sphingobium cupriresistens LL01]